jgi:hypothetical protein
MDLLSLLDYTFHFFILCTYWKKGGWFKGVFRDLEVTTYPQFYGGDAIAVRRPNPHFNQHERILCVTPVADCHLQKLLPKPNSASTVKNPTGR